MSDHRRGVLVRLQRGGVIVKSAEEWVGLFDKVLRRDAPEIVERIREEMRQEWEKENRAWCAAHNMPINTCLVGRMLSVGKPLLKKGQLVYQAYADNGRPLKWSDLCSAPSSAHFPEDGPVFLKAAME